MNFIVEEKIFNDFPTVQISVIVISNFDNTKCPDDVLKLTKTESERIRNSYQTETLSQDHHISVWRDAYKKFGAKSEYRSSVENLYRLVLKGIDLRQINPLVDLYNYISLKYMLPVGGEDLDQIKGNLVLGYATGDENPGLLLGENEPRPVHIGEALYKDDEGVVCRRWNWKEADRTKLTKSTKNAIIVIEGLGNIELEVNNATSELKNILKSYTSATRCFMLNSNNQQIDI